MRWPRDALTGLLGIKHPIIQAPMAGASTAKLAAAVSNAGALGGFGGTHSSPEELRAVIHEIRQRTDRPFIINLYLDPPNVTAPPRERVIALKNALTPAHRELNAGEVPDPIEATRVFDALVEAVIEERVPVLSTHFGAPSSSVMRSLKAAGTRVIATATTVDEAHKLVCAGVDAIIAQGSEAGGHRGTFDAPVGHANISTMALIPQIVDAVSVPVIAAGGIMDGRGIVAALTLGASGVQMGTAFVACPEAAVNPAYVDRLLTADSGNTVLTDFLSGRPARVLRNRLIDLLEQSRADALAYPQQLSMTRRLRAVAAATQNADFLPLFAGQGVAMSRGMPAALLIRSLVAEAQLLFSYNDARASDEQAV
jgi:nitronate monooxygenase